MKPQKLSNNSWRIRKMVNGKTYSLYFDHKPTKKEMERAIADTLIHPVEKSNTFKYYAEEFIRINENTLKPSTLRGYDSILRNLPESFLSLELNKITNADIQSMINNKAVEASAKTCSNYSGFISSIMSTYRPEFVPNVNVPAVKQYQKYVPTQEEVAAVIDYCKGTEFECVFRLLLYGLRRGEVCALTIDDLSDDNFLTINKAWSQDHKRKWHLKDTPKADASNRRIYIDKYLADLIRERGYIYKGSIGYLNKKLHEIQSALGQPSWRLHDMRSYMVTELSEKKIDEATILAVGGWSTSSVMKSAYRRSRYEQNDDMRNAVKEILTVDLTVNPKKS